MLDTFLLDAVSWARQAGAIQMRYFRNRALAVDTKYNDYDVVTAADKESDRLITECIKAKYPSHDIISEESGETHNAGAEYCWVIDPLDGTTNFSAGLPLFAVSIALQRNGETVLGVVYIPYLDETFHAIKGEGAYLGDNKIAVSQNGSLARAVVSTGFPVDKKENPDNNIATSAAIIPEVRGFRRLGAAAVDICYVAAGILDAYWELNLHIWDIAAATLIAEEAGAIVTPIREGRNYSILVTTPAIDSQIRKYVK
ncbi:MAG: inositol monophosphatase family protein [Muribaculaceae bacterium]